MLRNLASAAGLALGLAFACAPATATPISSGCSAIGQALTTSGRNLSYTGTFKAGETISVSLAADTGVAVNQRANDPMVTVTSGGHQNYSHNGIGGPYSYSIPSDGSYEFDIADNDGIQNGSVAATASCLAAPSQNAPVLGTNAAGTTAASNIQQQASQTAAQNSMAATNDMLSGVIAGAASNTLSPFSAGNGAVAMMVAPGENGLVIPAADAPTVSDSPWRLFASGRYTHASGVETGDQYNGVFGVSHRLGEANAYGLFGGIESFTYTDGTPAQFSGNGGTVGAFVAGKFHQRLQLDARLYGTLLDYNISAKGVSGATTAERLGATITASYEMGHGALSVVPFLRTSGLFEWQAAYTDSAAAAHVAQTLSEGMVAPGIRVAHRSTLENGWVFTPYLAGEANYAFGNGLLAGFNDGQGLSGRISAGATWTTLRGITFGVDGSYGGIGSTITSQSLGAKVSVPL